jgi:hypothetical protein
LLADEIGDLLGAHRELHAGRGSAAGCPGFHIPPCQQCDGCGAYGRGATLAVAAARAQARPHDAAGEALIIQPGGIVFTDPRREQLGLPGSSRTFIPLELTQNGGDSVGALHARGRAHVLPIEQEAQEVTGLHRLDFRAQALDRITVNARQQAPVAPLHTRCAGRERSIELAAHRSAFLFQRQQR